MWAGEDFLASFNFNGVSAIQRRLGGKRRLGPHFLVSVFSRSFRSDLSRNSSWESLDGNTVNLVGRGGDKAHIIIKSVRHNRDMRNRKNDIKGIVMKKTISSYGILLKQKQKEEIKCKSTTNQCVYHKTGIKNLIQTLERFDLTKNLSQVNFKCFKNKLFFAFSVEILNGSFDMH